MCNGALMVSLNSLVLANHKQSFIVTMLKLVDSTLVHLDVLSKATDQHHERVSAARLVSGLRPSR